MLDLLLRVSSELTSRGIVHAMIGAGALAVHGISRSTFDLDLFTTDRAALAASTWAALAGRGVAVDVRAGGRGRVVVEDRGRGALTFRAAGPLPPGTSGQPVAARTAASMSVRGGTPASP